MSKKYKKKSKAPKKPKLKLLFIKDLKKGLLKMRSLVLNGLNFIRCHFLGLLNLAVGLMTLSEVKALHEAMDNIASTVIAASLSGYINTMVLFSAISSELKSILSIFTGSPS